MKKTLLSISFILLGMLIIAACSEEEPGKSSEKITQEIKIEPEEMVSDSIPLDTLITEEPVVDSTPPPPPPPPPMPPSPWPDPDPWPDPWPDPDPKEYPLPDPPPPAPKPKVEVVRFPEVEPTFIGGEDAMKKFIKSNIKYPQIDREMNNQGRVFVEFIVEKDGSLSNIKVLRGVSETLDLEARRIVKIMPKWKSAESRGEIVRSKSILPITFTLF